MPFVILPTNSASGGYEVTNSLRFNSGSSDYLNRTPASAGNRQKFTLSFWVKRSKLSTGQYFLAIDTGATANFFQFNSSDRLVLYCYSSSGGVTDFYLEPNQLFRDVSAWYHIMLAVDTTLATADNRGRLYVNGSEVTSMLYRTNPTQNFNCLVNNTNQHNIGGTSYLDGYLSDVYFIDGQQLTPTSFGETDEDTGIWKPKAYTGTYGTNGFYLQFKNSASLGTDSSGNGNTFTVNNLTSVDQSTDTPTNNFATANPLEKEPPAYSNGNLTHGNGAVWRFAPSTIAVSSGKWYAEFKIGGGDSIVGIASVTDMANNTILVVGSTANSIGYDSSGSRGINNSFVAYGSSFTTNDIISIALDMNNNALYFAKNGTYQNSGVPTSGASKTGAINISTSDFYVLGMSQNNNTSNSNYGSPAYSANSYTDGAGFGNFSYSVPSGYYSLNTKNLSLYG